MPTQSQALQLMPEAIRAIRAMRAAGYTQEDVQELVTAAFQHLEGGGQRPYAPAKPSPLDVWAAADIVKAVQARQKTANGVPKASFVITMTEPRTRLGRNIDDALNEMGIPVLQARTTQRVAYPNAINDGNSVVAGRGQTVRNEILAIRGKLESLTYDD